MADLSEIQSSQSVKIAGANPSTGIEDNYLDIDSTGRPTVRSAQNSTSGSLTGSNTLDLDTAGMSILMMRISGTFTGSLNFLISLDGGSTYPDSINGYNEYNGLEYSAASSPALFKINISGYTNFRLSAAAITGTANVQMCATQGADIKTNAFLFDGTGTPLTSVAGSLDVNVNNIVQIQATSLPLPSGAATSVNQNTMITDLGALTETAPSTDTASSGLNGRLQRIAQRITSLIALLPGSLGQKTMANSLAITVASDQSAIPASQSGTWNITNVSGTVSLPTGAATSANQTTGNTSLSSIDGKFGSLGQKNMTGSAPVVISSDQSAIPVSQSGTWTVQPGNTANTTAWKVVADITSTVAATDRSGSGNLTALDTTVAANTQGMGSIIFNILGTWVGTIRAEYTVDGGTTWILMTGTDGSQSIFATTTSNDSFKLNCAGASQVRLRMSSYTSGTANITWNAGTAINNLQVWNTNATSLKVAARSDALNLTGSAASLNADVISAIDVSGYQALELQITGTFVGTITFQGSEDNSTFISILGTNISNSLLAPVSTTTTTGSFYIPLTMRYIRARMTSYTSGTAVSTYTFDTMFSGDLQARNVLITNGTNTLSISSNGEALVSQSTAANLNAQVVGNVASAATDSGNPVKIGGVYNSADPAPTNGQRIDLQTNSHGALNIQFRNTYSNLTSNATTTVKSGAGILHAIIINANWTGGTITIYDNTAASGTKIFTMTIGSPTGGLLSTSGQSGPFSTGPLGLEFSTGLTIVTAGSTSNNITVLYR